MRLPVARQKTARLDIGTRDRLREGGIGVEGRPQQIAEIDRRRGGERIFPIDDRRDLVAGLGTNTECSRR